MLLELETKKAQCDGTQQMEDLKKVVQTCNSMIQSNLMAIGGRQPRR